jgi:mycothiol synthase
VAGLRFRGATREDAEAVHALSQACADVDQQQERDSLEELDEQLRTEWWEPGTDGALGVDAAGEVLAYGAVLRRPGQVRTRQALLRGLVHPRVRGRGVGRALLAWQTARGEELLSLTGGGAGSPRMLRAYVEDHVTDRVALVRAAGFQPRRFHAVMGRDGALPVPEVPVPDGVALRRLSAATSGADLQERVRQAHNEAFADHWGSEPIEAADWRRYCVDGPGCRPDLSFAALDPSGQVVGYLVSGAYEQDWGPQGYTEGWTDLLGVTPRYRGQGLGRALLAGALQAYLDAGLERAGLGVDIDNPQALGLYLGLGFVERGRETSWVRDVTAPA